MQCEMITLLIKRRSVSSGLLRCGVFAIVIMAFSSCAVAAAEFPEDIADLRAELQTVERAITGRFGALPMRVIGRVRAGRLEGFGAVFLLELNVVPMANVSPFRKPYSEAERKNLNEKKRLKVEQLEEIGLDLLKDAAGSLGTIPPGENIALVIALFHFTWEDTTGLPSQLVLQAPRKILLDQVAGKIDEIEFRRKAKIRRF